MMEETVVYVWGIKTTRETMQAIGSILFLAATALAFVFAVIWMQKKNLIISLQVFVAMALVFVLTTFFSIPWQDFAKAGLFCFVLGCVLILAKDNGWFEAEQTQS